VWVGDFDRAISVHLRWSPAVLSSDPLEHKGDNIRRNKGTPNPDISMSNVIRSDSQDCLRHRDLEGFEHKGNTVVVGASIWREVVVEETRITDND